MEFFDKYYEQEDYFLKHSKTALVMFGTFCCYLEIQSLISHIEYMKIDHYYSNSDLIGCMSGGFYPYDYQFSSLFLSIIMSIISWNNFDRNHRLLPVSFTNKLILAMPILTIFFSQFISIIQF